MKEVGTPHTPAKDFVLYTPINAACSGRERRVGGRCCTSQMRWATPRQRALPSALPIRFVQATPYTHAKSFTPCTRACFNCYVDRISSGCYSKHCTLKCKVNKKEQDNPCQL